MCNYTVHQKEKVAMVIVKTTKFDNVFSTNKSDQSKFQTLHLDITQQIIFGLGKYLLIQLDISVIRNEALRTAKKDNICRLIKFISEIVY